MATMRFALVVGLLALLAASPAPAQQAPSELQATLPAGIQRQRDGSITLGPPFLVAESPDETVRLQVTLANVDGVLGAPRQVSWHMTLGDWCPARDATVVTVLAAPSGQRWSDGDRVIPAGGLHPGEPHRLFGSSNDSELLTALDSGGRFMLTLEDDEGRRLDEVAIQIPGPADRRRANRANQAQLRATDPASVPRTRQDRIEYVAPGGAGPFQAPARPVRECTPDPE